MTLAVAAVEALGADVEMVDLRTVWPFDRGAVLELGREDLAAARAPGGRALDRRRRSRALARRPGGVRAARRATGAARAARYTGSLRTRAGGRVPAVDGVDCAGAGGAPCLLTAVPCADVAAVRFGTRLELYRLVLLQRLVEERSAPLYRQGRIVGSVYDGRGQEAVAAAAGLALGRDDVVCPLNRELAMPFRARRDRRDALRNFLGRGDGPTRGRDGNMHFGVPAQGVFPLVSMLGDLMPVTVGAALAFKRRGEPRVALTFVGEGAFSVGDTHEGLNLAGVWQCLPCSCSSETGSRTRRRPSRQMVNTHLSERIYGGWSIPCERSTAPMRWRRSWRYERRSSARAAGTALRRWRR